MTCVILAPTQQEAQTMAERRDEDMSYISAAEAAEILGVSKRRVLRLIQLRRLPAMRIGNSFVLNRAVVEEYASGDRPAGRPTKAD